MAARLGLMLISFIALSLANANRENNYLGGNWNKPNLI